MEKYPRYLQVGNILVLLATILAIVHALRLLDVLNFAEPQDLFTPAVVMGLMGIVLHGWATRKIKEQETKVE